MQQPAVKLSNEAFHWLNERLQSAFDAHGQVPRHVLAGLDWPELPVRPAQVPEFIQEAFDGELHRMLDEARRAGRTSARVVARDLHRNVVGGAKPNRMRMACNAMWRLWRHQGSISENVINTTESRQSSTIEIEFILERSPSTDFVPTALANRSYSHDTTRIRTERLDRDPRPRSL